VIEDDPFEGVVNNSSGSKIKKTNRLSSSGDCSYYQQCASPNTNLFKPGGSRLSVDKTKRMSVIVNSANEPILVAKVDDLSENMRGFIFACLEPDVVARFGCDPTIEDIQQVHSEARKVF